MQSECSLNQKVVGQLNGYERHRGGDVSLGLDELDLERREGHSRPKELLVQRHGGRKVPSKGIRELVLWM